MATILAGTGFGQLISFQHGKKQLKKQVYGAPQRHIVKHIALDSQGLYYYATPKTLFLVSGEGTQEIVKINGEQKIIHISTEQELCRYCLSDGSIFTTTEKEQELVQFVTGQSHNKFIGAVTSLSLQKHLFFGQKIVPKVSTLSNGTLWWGKNVKHDELDLQVPINDIDGAFIKNENGLAIVHAKNKLRIYDIRGTHRRPVNDILLKTSPRANLTKMKISTCQNYYYFANDVGQIYRTDARKQWAPVNKFKGITTTITDMQISEDLLVVSSLDSYVRVFDMETRQMLSKYYLNKPIHSLYVHFQPKQHRQEFQQEVLSEEEEAAKPVHKVKQIRKRNKVGLKYLEPREFDTPPEVKQEEIEEKPWYSELNPKDRLEFQHNQ